MKKITTILMLAIIVGCGKDLNLKPDSTIVLPTTAQDLERLLDNSNVFNITPVLVQISADEYNIPNLSSWESLPQVTGKNASVWQKDIYGGETQIQDWIYPYKAIFYANNVLDILSRQDISQDDEKKQIKGWALFARSYSLYSLASAFCKSYQSNTAPTELGIPLKLSSNIDELVQRSSLQQTYDQIINDLLESVNLLQQNIISGKRNRPSKVAAYALLARVYLSMRKYDQAELFADKTLSIYSKLTDFNTLKITPSSSFTFDTEEVIYFSQLSANYGQLHLTNTLEIYNIDSELLKLYNPSDLRLQIYFTKNTIGNTVTKPINSLFPNPFTGLATDEIYLIKAESLVRRGQVSLAMDYLNQLASKRWNPNATGAFIPYQNITESDQEVALNLVLTERRKALVWRSLRWTDLKRLNLEGRNIKLQRKLGETIFTLDPNSTKYVLPIPDDEVALSGVQQNIR